jgi:hypothetical protein
MTSTPPTDHRASVPAHPEPLAPATISRRKPMPMSPDAPKTTAPHDSGSVRRRLAHSGVLDAWRSDREGRPPSTVAEIAGRLRDLGGVDADAGWIGAAAAVTNLAVAEYPDETLEEVWEPGVGALVSGTLAPQGSGTWVDGAFHVRATSSPASGLPWADWVMATVLDVDSAEPVRVLVPVHDVRVERTWDAAGLPGSGGDTAHLDDVVVPARRTRVLTPAPATAPLTFFATMFFAAPLIGAVETAFDRVMDEVAVGGARFGRADVRAAVSSAARRIARAKALSTAALVGLGTRAEVDALSAVTRATSADLAVQALASAESALPLLVSASGAAALHAEHPLARTIRDVGVGARHTALSPTKAALALTDALFEGRR